jgi:hypothetical protein
MNFNQASFINGGDRSKRLRHVHQIFAKNLQIPVAKFNVWYGALLVRLA